MENFTWWTEEHNQLQKEVREFAKQMAPREMETRWKREFAWDIFAKIGERGFLGAAIPKEYGGMGLGATGGCIVAEELHSISPGIGRIVVGNMIGGLRQIIEFGNEEQKQRFLPVAAKGELGAVVITEMTAGTDASGLTLQAKREGDSYVLNGKKRFIVAAGVAKRHFVYAKTSDNPEDIAKHRHITAFVVKKGTPGFNTEQLNEILAFENIQNGSFDFDNVIVPLADRIGEEGEGWKIMMEGLNFERTLIAAGTLGWQRTLLRYAVPYAQRRVQFGKPTIDIPANQTKIADVIMKLTVSRLAVYHTAYLWDLGKDITIESSTIKAFGAENTLQSALDVTQVMGGDGVNRFYPVQNIFEVAKVEHIAGGTVEACRLVIFRSGLKLLAEDMQMPRRVKSEELGVPIPTFAPVEKKLAVSEDAVLAVLAEDYRVNPGLHMMLIDIKQYIDANDEALVKAIEALEKQGLVMAYRTRKGIQMAKATYEGLKKAHPKEYYKWYPQWATEDRR
ncbi:MAG: CaiA [Firmicutes bacterium]|nr:CaiA [Bacillota bacterium]